MLQFLRNITAACLALVLTFGSVSKDWLHLFTHHHDTVHTTCIGHGEKYFDNEHHHCDFLSFTLQAFTSPDFHYHFTPKNLQHFYPKNEITLPSYFSETCTAAARGPPRLFC